MSRPIYFLLNIMHVQGLVLLEQVDSYRTSQPSDTPLSRNAERVDEFDLG